MVYIYWNASSSSSASDENKDKDKDKDNDDDDNNNNNSGNNIVVPQRVLAHDLSSSRVSRQLTYYKVMLITHYTYIVTKS